MRSNSATRLYLKDLISNVHDANLKKFSKNGKRKHKHTIISDLQMLKLQVSLYPQSYI